MNEQIETAWAEAPREYNRNCLWCCPQSIGGTQCHCKTPCGSKDCAPADEEWLTEESDSARVFTALRPLREVPRFARVA